MLQPDYVIPQPPTRDPCRILMDRATISQVTIDPLQSPEILTPRSLCCAAPFLTLLHHSLGLNQLDVDNFEVAGGQTAPKVNL